MSGVPHGAVVSGASGSFQGRGATFFLLCCVAQIKGGTSACLPQIWQVEGRALVLWHQYVIWILMRSRKRKAEMFFLCCHVHAFHWICDYYYCYYVFLLLCQVKLSVCLLLFRCIAIRKKAFLHWLFKEKAAWWGWEFMRKTPALHLISYFHFWWSWRTLSWLIDN